MNRQQRKIGSNHKGIVISDIKNLEKEGVGPETIERVDENSADIKGIQADINRSEQDFLSISKQTASAIKRLDAIEASLSDIDVFKKRIEKIDFEGLSQEMYKQFERMNGLIKENDEQSDDSIEKLNVELKTLSEKIDEFNKAREHIEKLDIPNIRRDIEIIMQKNQYIENQLHSIDVQPLVSMVREVDSKLRTLESSSAMIIE